MSVLIKGMKMPKHCTECDFWHDGVFEHCVLNDEIQNDDLPECEGQYPVKCPLVELPPHGRLIDAGEFEVVSYKGIPDGYRDTFDDGALWMCEKIDNAPTIITAEEVSE